MMQIDLTRPFHTRIRVEEESPVQESGVVTVDARSEGPPLHLHGGQDERWEILEGTLNVRRGADQRALGAGETYVVPRATAHTYWNEADTPCVFRYTLTPGSQFTAMMRTFEMLARDGRLESTKDLRSLMHMAQVFVHFREHVRAVKPPQWVMAAMARVGRALGVVLPFEPR